MTSLSDFPPDVVAIAVAAIAQADAKAEALGEPTDTVECIAEAIMADRAGRIAPRIGGLTAHQKRVMDYLTWFIGKNGISPSFEDIRTHLGLASKSSVYHVICELEDRGAIKRLPNRSRSITIINAPGA